MEAEERRSSGDDDQEKKQKKRQQQSSSSSGIKEDEGEREIEEEGSFTICTCNPLPPSEGGKQEKDGERRE